MSAWRSALSSNVRELRIHLAQGANGSKGARDFIVKNYADLKAANPQLPILIREAPGIEARVFARYAFGVERKVSLENLSEADVESRLKQLAETKPSSA
ncbi:thioredoxin-like protein [Entophlyctis helioformis]|nr:thioredoxin-like protein [Entophlyctis helioformis]